MDSFKLLTYLTLPTVNTTLVISSGPTITIFRAKVFTDSIRVERFSSVTWIPSFAKFALWTAPSFRIRFTLDKANFTHLKMKKLEMSSIFLRSLSFRKHNYYLLWLHKLHLPLDHLFHRFRIYLKRHMLCGSLSICLV